MSLLNQMLRDLANQHQEARIRSDDQSLLLADACYAREEKTWWLPSLLIFAFVLTSLFSAHYWFRSSDNLNITQQLPEYPASSPAVIESSESGAEESVAEALVETVDPQLVAAEQSVAQESPLPTADETAGPAPEESASAESSVNAMQQLALDAWLKLAATALQQDRLTFPVGDNAFEYYRRVLDWDPEHPQAQRGLVNILERYLRLIDEAAQRQEWQRARQLLDRAKSVTAPQTPMIEQALQAWEVRLNSASLVETPKVAESATTVSTAIESNLDKVSFSVPEPPPVRAADQQVAPNRQWQDQQMADQARRLFQQGQVESARTQLEFFLHQQGSATLSSQMLCHIYLESGELEAAEKLIADAESQGWPRLDLVRLQAQWLVARGDQAAAIAQLETHLPEAQEDERYRVLLASLYQTSGRYHEAVASYRRLLTSFGEKISYWLGLALALDALGQRASALEAYGRVRELRPQQTEVMRYIEQRIAALSR